VFKGNDRDIFIDKKEYTGPLYEQIEEAYKFVLRNIKLASEIEGIVRTDKYELPTGAIREMIINSVVHRNFLDNACVQVAIYDNRFEVTSPGMLYGGLSIEEAKNGRSKIRNKAIAEVFSRMEIVEARGTGIKRIISRASEYELDEPEFIEIGDTFRVNLFKSESSSKIAQVSQRLELSKLQAEILDLMYKNPNITRQEIASDVNKTMATIKKHIATLNEIGIIEYLGSSKKGEWVVNSNESSPKNQITESGN